ALIPIWVILGVSFSDTSKTTPQSKDLTETYNTSNPINVVSFFEKNSASRFWQIAVKFGKKYYQSSGCILCIF
ncbi:hypothetical protein IKO50_07315, partial [bacterium]|nr:hypothetical protein [bacterium]